MTAEGALTAEQVEARTRELLRDLAEGRKTVEDVHGMLPGSIQEDSHALDDMKRGMRMVGRRPMRSWLFFGPARLGLKDSEVQYGTGMAVDTVADLGKPHDLEAAAAIACLMALRHTFMQGPGAVA